MSLGLGIWPTEPETLGNTGTSTFPDHGLSDVSKLAELAAAALGDRGLYQGLDNVGTCARGLGLIDLHLL